MSKKSKRVAICLITDHRDNILMGRRNDNAKWSTPGGHLYSDEDPYRGAVRECKEETGLDVKDIELIGSRWDKEQNIILYLFKIIPDPNQTIDTSQDPDGEFDDLSYIDPNDVVEELHIPLRQNIALQYWMKN